MLIESIARRYAKAVFDAALAEKGIDTLGHELTNFVETLNQEKPLRDFWLSIRVPELRKKDFIRKLFPALSSLMGRFLFVLIDKRREKLIEKCAVEYEKLLLDFYNQVFAEVQVVVPMPVQVQAELKERLSQKLGKRVELLVTEDPSLLGGMVLRIGDRVVDGSLRSKLNGMKEALLSAPLPA